MGVKSFFIVEEASADLLKEHNDFEIEGGVIWDFLKL